MSVEPPTIEGPCVVMVDTRLREIEAVTHLLSKVNRSTLVTYRGLAELVQNPPARRAGLLILASDDAPGTVQRALQWLRYRYPRSLLAVVADEGGTEHEIAARSGAAMFLSRPVDESQWRGLLEPVLPVPASPGPEGGRPLQPNPQAR